MIPKKILPYLVVFLLLSTTELKAQVTLFKPGWQADSMKNGVDQLYNYQFVKAQATIAPVRKLDPQNPAVKIFDCLELYWKYFPITVHPVEYKKYKADLETALDYTLGLLKKDDKNVENSFYALLLHIMLARQMYEDGERWSAMNHTIDAFTYIKRGFTLQEKCSEFLLSSGLYKFYREFFGEMNPVYKPLLAPFPSGNKTEGLMLLDKATYTTIFVKPEAMMFSSYINLRYQDNEKEGMRFANMMNANYPDNYLFKVLYVENLIQSEEYEKARVELNKLVLSPVTFYKLPSALFRAMLEERYAHNIDEAIKWYELAVKLGTPVTKATENYVGLAYYSLADIYDKRGNKVAAKTNFKKAEEYCTYVKLKKDAAKRK